MTRYAVIGRENVVEWAPDKETADKWAEYRQPLSTLASSYEYAAVYSEDDIARLRVWDNDNQEDDSMSDQQAEQTIPQPGQTVEINEEGAVSARFFGTPVKAGDRAEVTGHHIGGSGEVWVHTTIVNPNFGPTAFILGDEAVVVR